MFLADHLSRVYIASKREEDQEFQVFALEVETLNPLDSLSVSNKSAVAESDLIRCRSPKLEDNSVGRMA